MGHQDVQRRLARLRHRGAGAKAQYRFQIKNIYEEDAHISSVRSSCGCTTPELTKADLKTFETGELIADFNTRDFLGHKSATLTVTFDRPYPAEVQLQISGVIQGDVVLEPGALNLGTIDLGKGTERRLRVSYVGRENWKIVDVKTLDPHFEVEITELARAPGKIVYDLLVRLTKDAPVGYIKDQLVLVTNDPRAAELPVDLEGRVISDITISPSQLFIGVVHPGQKVTKKLVVRGKKPFKIIDVKCPDKSFEIDAPKDARAVHLIPVVFTAGDDPGRIAQKISILTDQGDNVVQAFTAFAEIVKPQAAASTTSSAAVSPVPPIASVGGGYLPLLTGFLTGARVEAGSGAILVVGRAANQFGVADVALVPVLDDVPSLFATVGRRAHVSHQRALWKLQLEHGVIERGSDIAGSDRCTHAHQNRPLMADRGDGPGFEDWHAVCRFAMLQPKVETRFAVGLAGQFERRVRCIVPHNQRPVHWNHARDGSAGSKRQLPILAARHKACRWRESRQ